MRVTHHGNDLVVTDQALGLGAFLIALGALFCVAALDRMISGDLWSIATGFYGLAGAWAIKAGGTKLVATQIIVDMDDRHLVTRRWSLFKTQEQRVPFAQVTGFTIEPAASDTRTHLYIQTDRGPLDASGGSKGVRAAWQDVQAAIEAHMAAESTEPDQSA